MPPLPNPNRRRRNAPRIPTVALPASGLDRAAPDPPDGLGEVGLEWWAWAWSLPQAAAWSDGDCSALGRRAALEDDVAAFTDVHAFDLREWLELDEDLSEANRRLKSILQTMRSLSGGKLAVMREMRELDDRFGLTPKGLAALRWTIVQGEDPVTEPAPASSDPAVSSLEKRREAMKRTRAS